LKKLHRQCIFKKYSSSDWIFDPHKVKYSSLFLPLPVQLIQVSRLYGIHDDWGNHLMLSP